MKTRFSVKKGKGLLTFKIRPSRASKRSRIIKSHEEAREVVRKIYPELEKQDKYYWRTHHVHHIDKNPLNNDPNNLAIVLKNEHEIYHLKKYDWSDRICSRCNGETVHLNNRCTVCHYRKKKLNEIPQPIRT
jgi:hypothetical protein